MIRALPLILLLPAAADAPAIRAGGWANTITVREVVAPGVPGFLLRTAKGKSRTMKVCIPPQAAATGPAALLAPDPKAKCTVERQAMAAGRYEQVLSCPQKSGAPLRVERTGRYDANGLTGQVSMAGTGPKGSFRFAGDQRVSFAKPNC